MRFNHSPTYIGFHEGHDTYSFYWDFLERFNIEQPTPHIQLITCLVWFWLSTCGKFTMKIPRMSEKRTHLTYCQSISGMNAKSELYILLFKLLILLLKKIVSIWVLKEKCLLRYSFGKGLNSSTKKTGKLKLALLAQMYDVQWVIKTGRSQRYVPDDEAEWLTYLKVHLQFNFYW